MELAFEFSKRLNDAGESLAKRLCLAQIAFESPALPVQLKEEVILGWLRGSDKSLEDVWLVLQSCIFASNVTDLSPSVASSIVRMVCEGLECDMTKSTRQVVYTCATKILDSTVFRWSLMNQIQDYLDLIVVVLDTIEDCDTFMKTVVSVKDFYCDLVENKNEFVEGFVRHVLFRLLKLYSNTVSILLVREKVTTLTATLVNSVQHILFPEKESSKRIRYLNYVFSSEDESVLCNDGCVIPMVISELHAALKKFPSSLCSTGFCVILQSFISVHRTDHMVVVKFLSICFHLVGFTLKIKCEAEDTKLTLNKFAINEIPKPFKQKAVSYVVVSSIVKTLTEINLVVENDSETYLASLLLEACMSAIHRSKRQNICSEYLDMCSSVIYYSPAVIASKIFEFLVPIMLCRKCDDIELSITYLGFLHCVLEVFVKLSRVQKLITKLLPSIRDAALEGRSDGELIDVLPKDFCKELCMSVMQLPSQQMFSIMKSFCYHLQEDCVVPLVLGKSGGVPQLYVRVLARLTSTFLLGVRVASQVVPTVVVSTFASQLVELEEILAHYATALLSRQSNELEMVGLLEICHSVGELHLMLANYCPQTWKMGMSQPDMSMYNFSGLHPYITSGQWNVLTQRINSCDQEIAKEIINDLLLQKLVALQLFGSSCDSRVQQAAIARHFVSLPSEQVTKLVCSLPMLAQSLEKQDLLILARDLSEAVSSCQEVHTSLLAALQREAMQEDKNVIETLLWVTVEQIGSIIVKCISREIESCPFQSQEMLTTYFLNRFSHSKSNKEALSPLLENLGSLISLASEEDNIFLSERPENIDMKMLEWHVNILKTLPVTFMPLDIQGLVALVSVLGIECLSKISPKNTLIGVLCSDILLGLMENTKALNLGLYVHTSSVFCWLLGIGENIDKTRHRLLFRRLFDNHFRHKGKFKDLQPMLSKAVDVKGFLESSFGILSALLSSLNKHAKQQLCKKEKFIRKIILLPIAKLIATVKAEHHMLDSAMLEVFTKVLMLELGMTEFIVTKLYMTEFISIALAGLCSKNEGLVQNCTLFLKLLLQQSKKLSGFLPQDFVHTVWAKSSTHISEQQGKLVVEAASDEEFDMIIISLLQKTEDRFASQSPIDILMLWWRCVVSCSLTSGKCAVRQTAVESVCISLLAALNHYHQDIVKILKFEEAMISNPQVRMGSHMIDLCLLSISSIPLSVVGEEFTRVWPVMLSVLHHLHKHSSIWLWDRLPSMLQCYRQLVSSLAAQSDVKRNIMLQEMCPISTAALELTKFTSSLVTSSQHLKRVCPYLIADTIHELETHNIHPSVKVHFQNCINYLLSMSDLNAVTYLHRVLKPSERELFKSMYETYKKYFMFTGKI